MSRDVALDLADRRLLVRRQLEGKRAQEARRQLPGRRERGRDHPRLLAALVQQQADLHQQQLLEHEAGTRDGGLLERARQVHGQSRVGAGRQALPHAQGRRQRVGEAPHHGLDLAHHGAQQARGDLLACRVDRHDALRVKRVPFLVVQDLVAAHEEGRVTRRGRSKRRGSTKAT